MDKSTDQRFNMDAATVDDAMFYFKNRALQLILGGFVWTHEKTLLKENGEVWGVKTSFINDKDVYQSIYVLAGERNKGFTKKHFSNPKNRTPIVTVKGCNIESYLNHQKIPYVIGNKFIETAEYKLISNFYDNKKSKRSGIFKMNHIDEGIYILSKTTESLNAMKAFCLHPILQSDEDLINNYLNKFESIDPAALILAMEYRWVANLYLSKRTITHLDEIRLSPIFEVNQMLVADKVQNYKDFITYHQNSHERKEELTRYFNNWLMKLKILPKDYDLLIKPLLDIERGKQ